MVSIAARERAPSTTETKQKISQQKRGIPQSEAHRAARREGRKPKFQEGDTVDWFGEQGVVVRYLGVGDVHGDGRQALWYKVRFNGVTRDLLQEVLAKV